MCWFPLLPRPRGPTYTKRDHKHHRDDSSPLLGPRLAAAPTSAQHHRHHRVALPSHHPATSQTSLTPHYQHHHQHIYNVRAPRPHPQPHPARHPRAPAVLSSPGVKRAPPRAWDEWDDEALDRRRRRYRPCRDGLDGYGRRVPHGFASGSASGSAFGHASGTGTQHPRPRARANSSARRQRPLIDVTAHENGNGASFAARAAAQRGRALDDVLRAAMYDGGDGRGDVAVRVAAPVNGRRRGRRGGGGGGTGVGVDVRGRPLPWPPAGGLEGWM